MNAGFPATHGGRSEETRCTGMREESTERDVEGAVATLDFACSENRQSTSSERQQPLESSAKVRGVGALLGSWRRGQGQRAQTLTGQRPDSVGNGWCERRDTGLPDA